MKAEAMNEHPEIKFDVVESGVEWIKSNAEIEVKTLGIKSEANSKLEEVETVVEENMNAEAMSEHSEIDSDVVEEITSGVKWIKSVGV